MNLPDLLRQIVELNESGAVVVNESLDPIEIGLDKRRVERMVANLLQNAANYADGATDVVVSQVRGPDGERRVRISVGDRGPGVPPEERDSIFERFRRGQSHMRGTSAKRAPDSDCHSSVHMQICTSDGLGRRQLGRRRSVRSRYCRA